MLNIPDSFFKEEERNGFLIPEKMKRAWAAEMKILDQLKDFFEEHGITYFIEFGSLLGTIRHKGFIPWDDDIDISMSRADFMKFVSLSDQLPHPLRLKSIYTQGAPFSVFHGVVCNTRSERLEWDEERMELYYGCPFICAVDVFPFDFVPRDETDSKFQRILYALSISLAQRFDKEGTTANFRRDLKELEERIGGKFDKNRPLRNQLFELTDRIAMMCSEEAADRIAYFPNRTGLNDTPFLYPREWYAEGTDMPFEGVMEVRVPKHYDEILTLDYRDYMVCRQTHDMHGYPFYAEQEEYLNYLGYKV